MTCHNKQYLTPAGGLITSLTRPPPIRTAVVIACLPETDGRSGWNNAGTGCTPTPHTTTAIGPGAQRLGVCCASLILALLSPSRRDGVVTVFVLHHPGERLVRMLAVVVLMLSRRFW
jgi:hypothetical protein